MPFILGHTYILINPVLPPPLLLEYNLGTLSCFPHMDISLDNNHYSLLDLFLMKKFVQEWTDYSSGGRYDDGTLCAWDSVMNSIVNPGT